MPLLKVPWHTVPDAAFAADNSTLARQFRCTPEAVRQERRRRGLPPARRPGKLPSERPAAPRSGMKPALRLSRPALLHVRQLAAAAGVNASDFILSLPLPPPPPQDPAAHPAPPPPATGDAPAAAAAEDGANAPRPGRISPATAATG